MFAGETGNRDGIGKVPGAFGDDICVEDDITVEHRLGPLFRGVVVRRCHRQNRAVEVNVVLDQFVALKDPYHPGGRGRVGVGEFPFRNDLPTHVGAVLEVLGKVVGRVEPAATPSTGKRPEVVVVLGDTHDGGPGANPGHALSNLVNGVAHTGVDLQLKPGGVQDQSRENPRVPPRPQRCNQSAHGVSDHENWEAGVILSNHVEGSVDLFVVVSEVEGVTDGLPGSKGASVFAQVQGIESSAHLGELLR